MSLSDQKDSVTSPSTRGVITGNEILNRVFKNVFIYMYVWVHLSVCHTHGGPCRVQKKVWDPLKEGVIGGCEPPT